MNNNRTKSSHYSKMARYYDTIYGNIVDYESQSDYLERIFAKHRDWVNSILDIACGTGNYTFLFAERGYETTGIDSSEEMIGIAKRKRRRNRTNPQFFQMDMRDMHLKGRFDVATVLFGGFGYLLKFSDVKKFFSSVKNVLDHKGLLIFEFWHNAAVLPETASPSGRRNFDVSRKENLLIIRLHHSKYDPLRNTIRILFGLHIINTKQKKLVDSFSETHVIKTYSISEVANLLEENGFKPLAFYEGGVGKMKKLEPAKQSTFRVLAVARPRIQN